MTNTEKSSITLDDDEILEGAMFNVRQTRYLKYIVIVMGIMLVFGFIALAIAVMNKASKKKSALKKARIVTSTNNEGTAVTLHSLSSKAALKKDITLNLPKNSKILSYKMNGNQMILHVRAKKINQIIILDMTNGEIKSRIHLPQ